MYINNETSNEMAYAVLYNPESFDYGFHFLSIPVLEEIVDCQNALSRSANWDHLKSNLSPARFDEIVALVGGRPEDPNDLDISEIRYDLNWPMHVLSDEFDCLPREARDLVQIGQTRSGSFKYISLQNGLEIIRLLEEIGVKCMPADEMMKIAYGFYV